LLHDLAKKDLMAVDGSRDVLPGFLKGCSDVLALTRVSVHVAITVSIFLILEINSLLESISDAIELKTLDALVVIGNTESLAELLRDFWRNLVEDSKLLHKNLGSCASAHVSSKIADHAILSTWLVSVDLVPHLSGLNEVDTVNRREVA
jgi:hypothetical protein